MKDWFTAEELSQMDLPGMPATKRAFQIKAKSGDWKSRVRENSYGVHEYEFSSLPLELQTLIAEQMASKGKIKDIPVTKTNTTEDKKAAKAAAKTIVLQQVNQYLQKAPGSKTAAMASFVKIYCSKGFPNIPQWVYEAVPSVTDRSLWRWRKQRQNDDFNALGRSRNARKKTGILDLAEDGAVARYIAAIITKQPHLNAEHVQDLCLAQFGDTLTGEYPKTGKVFKESMPTLRTFQNWIARWKVENADVLEKITNPDGYKNKRQIAIGRADAGIECLNQLWEIDASPADVLCVDGRYSIYAIIDVWSRRAMFSVSKTACTEASLSLVRRAIMEWGVPEAIKTDNGADFISRRFTTALAHLGIEQPLCQPFTPESKPHVERVIGTLQRGLMPLLDGYVGHSVADRKQIEARKAFAQRLGESADKAFAVKLTHEDLQARMDAWASDKYAHRPHSGINNQSPFERAASWPYPIKKIEDERALDVLLSPLAGQDGYRTITKKGLRINNGYFYAPGLELHVGARVFVRHDDEDMGRVFVFDEDGQFICEAINHDRLGVDRRQAAMLAKASQKKHLAEKSAELKRDMRKITPEKMAEDVLAVAREKSSKLSKFPSQSEAYTNEALEEASKAFEREPVSTDMSPDERKRHEKFLEDFHAPKITESEEERAEKAREEKLERLMKRQEQGEELPPEEERWVYHVVATPWYRAKKAHEDRLKGD